jgi:hypothetical protein
MKPAELLAELGRIGVVVEEGDDGRPVLDGALTDELLAAARDARWLFTWGLHGATSGHRWHACDACQEVQLLNHGRGCGMTPGCRGRMVPAASPVFRGSLSVGRRAS